MKVQELWTAVKNVASAAGRFISSAMTTTKVGSLVKVALFVGVSVGTAVAVCKTLGIVKTKTEETEMADEDTESLLYTGLRLTPEDFKNTRMHPSMETIENFNRTFEKNVREEFMRPTAENRRFLNELRRVKHAERKEKKNKKKKPSRKIQFDIGGLTNKNSALNFINEFYNNQDEYYPEISLSGLMD